MAARNKVYYPSWEITTGLYTKGGEFMTEDDEKEYIGPYHRYNDGLVMTLPNYSSTKSKRLEPLRDKNNTELNSVYESIKRIDVLKYKTPVSFLPKPTDDDYARGYIDRYFIKRRNDPESKIFEVDLRQYNNMLGNSTINGSLYSGISLRWKISGPQYDIYENNNLISGIIDTNKRTVASVINTFIGIDMILGKFDQFAEYNKTLNSLQYKK